MSNTGKQSPLGVNVLGSLLQNTGFYINPTAQSYMGVSKRTDGDYQSGKIVNDTCLKFITNAIQNAYVRGAASQTDPVTPTGTYTVDSNTYNNLLNIGQSRIAALGNSPPPTYETTDPSGVWTNKHQEFYKNAQAGAPANAGYGFYSWDAPVYNNLTNKQEAYKNEGQCASWYPFLATVEDPDNPGNYLEVPNRNITQWGWIRCMALQAYNEFNFNGETVEQLNNSPVGSPEYKDFVDSFMTADGFVNFSNQAIYAIEDSQNFLKGTYSNQNDLISADIAGVSLSSKAFGQDLLNLGKAIDLRHIKTFGLPSNLLQTLKNNNALTQSVILALLASELNQNEIENISNGNTTPTKLQEQKIYGAFLVIAGTDLNTILITLNCRTKGINTLADLLSVKKLFPQSFTTLTVPVYNTSPGPTNSKTYYLLFIKQELNPQLVTPKIKSIVGTIVPPAIPQPVEPSIIVPTIIDPPNNIIGGGGCVALESYIPLVEHEIKHNNRPITNAYMLESNMELSLGTDDLKIVSGKIKMALNDYQPCLRIVTTDGISLVCSTTARILTKEKGYMPATELYGLRVAVRRNNSVWYDEVIQLEDVGMKFVRVVDAGDHSFWAGEKPGSYILHHNVLIDQEYKYAKN